MVFLLVAGPVAIEFLYGHDWIGAGEPLRVMVVGAVFLMLALTLRGFINAQGMIRQLIPINILALIMTLVAVVALSPWGLIAIAVGISLREAVVFVAMVRLLGRSRVQLRFSELGHTIAPSLSASAVGLIGGVAALQYGRDIGLGNGFILITLVGFGTFVGYAVALLGLMALWRSHAPLASTRGLMLEGIRGIGHRMRPKLRAA
jgi:O-antigen/teichoic acid export membrane protein